MPLLAEHLRADVPIERAPTVLLAVASAIASDAFYRLTEPLWERLLRSQPFAEIHQLLCHCEQRLKHVDPHPRVVFYLRILRPALWNADPRWIDRAIALIEKHGAVLDSASETELEFILLVRTYLREDRGRIGDREARRQLDEMIRGYCTSDWRTAAAAVVTVQDSIARDIYGLIASFPMNAVMEGGASDDNRLLTICLMIASDVAEQTGVDYDITNESMTGMQAAAALKDLNESLSPVIDRMMWFSWRDYGLPLVGALAPPLLLWGLVPVAALAVLFAVWATAATLTYFLVLKPRYLDPMVENEKQRMMLRAYEDAWRPRLFRYVQSCGHAGTALQYLLGMANVAEAGEGMSAGWLSAVLTYAELDPALLIFSRAQAFTT